MTAPPLIETDALRFAYPGGPDVLSGVSLRVERGERVALVGPNGAGKSTLLLCLVGLLEARGRVVVEGVELSRKTARDVRRRVGLVFQDPDDQLFMPTVGEDVAFGPAQMGLSADEVAARTSIALAAVGLAGFEERPPHRLSGGEKRAASLATVLSMQPALLALDEPTTGLDPRSRRRLIELIAAEVPTCLLATHDLEMVLAVCDRAVLLDGGSIVAEGPPRGLLADAARMEGHGLEVPLSIALG